MSYLNCRKIRDIGKLSFFISPLALVVCLVGCVSESDDSTDSPAVVTKYTVEIVQSGLGGTISPIGITSYEVPAGKNQVLVLTVTLEPGCKVDSMKINNTLVKLTGNTYSLLVDKDCKVEAYFSRTILWWLIQHPWKTARVQKWNANTMKLELDLYPPDIGVELFTYHPDYSLEIVNYNGVTENWHFGLEDSLLFLINGKKKKVVEISDKTLILEFISPFASQSGPDPTKDSLIRETYKKSD
jgi:hypothetical protein